MFRSPRILVLFILLLTAIADVFAQQPKTMQMTSFRPSMELGWQRTSPTPQQPGGPVLYQIIFRSSATPGNIPVISPTFTLMNSHIADSGTMLNFSEPVVFAGGQTFPASGLPNLAGEVSGPVGTTVVSNAVTANTANAIVRRDGSGNFYAGTVTLSGSLVLPSTTSASVGVITLGNTPFLHNFGDNSNSFVGASAGNFTMTGTNNTVMGFNALSSNSTGGGNSAFGANALQTNTAGSANAAFGDNALSKNTASFNSAFGADALTSNTTGTQNEAFGLAALRSNTTGSANAAFGGSALFNNTTGAANTAFGALALYSNTGSSNEAFGYNALFANTTGNGNTAFGYRALQGLVSGGENIAIGDFAGFNLTGGESNNIYIGDSGMAGESNTIRIGGAQTATFISGVSTSGVSGVGVFVDASGRLGFSTSSRRFKQDIVDLGAESDILMKLRPVAFYYKPEIDSTHTRQYGLVAEEVAQTAPGLVLFGNDGRPQTVRYHLVNAMLLNEVQKQHRLIESQQGENRAQHRQLAAQEDEISVQQQQMRAMQEQMETLRRQNADLEQQIKAVMLRLAAMEKSGRQISTEEAALTRAK
jgi:hypothetical protein